MNNDNTEVNLEKEVGWVLFTYPDNSKLAIATTLNLDLLYYYTQEIREDHLFDIYKRRWIKIPEEEAVILEMFRNKPDLGEVDEYANRFI